MRDGQCLARAPYRGAVPTTCKPGAFREAVIGGCATDRLWSTVTSRSICRVSMKEELVQQLLVFPATHPYAKWAGTHWRLVEIADAGVPLARYRLEEGVNAELTWLLPGLEPRRVSRIAARARRHASMEGNAVYALSRLGYANHPGTQELVGALLEWQWPDGGWNCDRRPEVTRSSFHESVTPALGLAHYAQVTENVTACRAAERTADLLLRHRLIRSMFTGEPVHQTWTVLHYPAYWH